MNKLLKSVLQIGFFMLVSIAMNQLVVLMHWPIPGSILGIVVVFIGLQTKLIKLEWIDAGASWLLAEMLLFFIPPAVSLIQYEDLIMSSGLRILLVMLVSSIAVMAGAGFLAQWMVKDKRRNP
ncbi:CidA/LrgA family holin-like protein [Paenibacillus sp. WQ 127069]|jgi:holin-like protein|uniref:CidA/LrgA family holin-like protein n=1 Tax=Paenibacillus baimaensis TaxID=2982185 RepID=A0ABT2UTB0_9BACL|nr:CidA/LrgA family holin-like protein [Paenibacillus sp. WQ 127069]MCU6797067.1 CidA/LrgA family holin-like protein [Paenibacillus sp. WQ 127069]